MRRTDTGTAFSATDLSDHLACAHKTTLELGVLSGQLSRPGHSELERALLERRGRAHEAEVLEHFRGKGKTVVAITAQPGAAGAVRAAEDTLAAMAAGAEVIYQGALAQPDEGWMGRPDFLIRVDGACARWPHHYEVVDAKLAREAKARAVLQLCVYTDHLTRLQGLAPKHFHIATGGGGAPTTLLAADYMAYQRAVRARFTAFAAAPSPTYPEPVEHCDVCAWWKSCEDRRRADDHLSLVAGITRRQRDRLANAGITNVAALAALSPEGTIPDVSPAALARVRDQASLQVQGRQSGAAIYRLLSPSDPNTGLAALPEPTPGDLFLDLEGDAFVGRDGLDYLFGLVELGTPDFGFSVRKTAGPPNYTAHFAHDAAGEKRAFEAVIDRIKAGREEFRDLHVFHFGHRESDALKRLSCKHKTREDVVDDLLRSHVLVDLLPIVRHGLRASVEGYTLKQLEPLHRFSRKQDVREAGRAMALYGWWLETADATVDVEALRARIARYNEEDCLSTHSLRDWLEARRLQWQATHGKPLPRPARPVAELSEDHTAAREASARLTKRLLAGLPNDAAHDDASQSARRLMADLLDWHWREAKSGFWEFYRARDLPPPDRFEDRSALAGLQYDQIVDKVKRSLVHRYTFPEQEHAIRAKPGPIDPDTTKAAGTVVALGPRHVDLKRAATSTAPHPTALVPGGPLRTEAQQNSLMALGESLLGATDFDLAAAQALLTRARPMGIAPGQPVVQPNESVTEALRRIGLALDGGVLAVQGPPGSGKTHEAATLMVALIAAGKRVGVTANSHTVIKGVLRKVLDLAGDTPVRALHIEDDADEDPNAAPFEISNDKAKVRSRLAAGDLNLVGGTSWTWAHADFANTVDVLVIDEAGQVSLANGLAVARAARNLVLFGDPAQLEQPQKGVHPAGAEASTLEHLLGGDALTIPADRGVFIPRTRRLHPQLCDFISKVFYEGRLHPHESLGLDRQRVDGPGILRGAGLRHVPVVHRGNTNQSIEEAAAVARLVETALTSNATFTDGNGTTRPLTAADILVVAPYNAHVATLARSLPADVQVGTVDKFQGKEAPIVIYSMATSTAEDAPRGLEFLFSLNRLNVAISRAQALAVLVASPDLPRVSCQTPRQMKLVNALCTYLESAATSP